MVFLHLSCCGVVIAHLADEELVPVEPDVDPGVHQAVQGHQPEQGFQLILYHTSYVFRPECPQ